MCATTRICGLCNVVVIPASYFTHTFLSTPITPPTLFSRLSLIFSISPVLCPPFSLHQIFYASVLASVTLPSPPPFSCISLLFSISLVLSFSLAHSTFTKLYKHQFWLQSENSSREHLRNYINKVKKKSYMIYTAKRNRTCISREYGDDAVFLILAARVRLLSLVWVIEGTRM